MKRWVIHPSFTYYYAEYDIAIIELKEPAKINKHVNTACLPFLEPTDKSTVLISGWGSTRGNPDKPNILQKASVDIVSREECNDHCVFFDKK